MTLSNDLVPVLNADTPHPGPGGRTSDDAPHPAFAAQIMGQPGVKRGLRSGEAVLKIARAAYLGAEYSGDYDRRPPPGLLRRTQL